MPLTRKYFSYARSTVFRVMASLLMLIGCIDVTRAELVRAIPIAGSFLDFKEFDNKIWIGTSQGALILEKNSAGMRSVSLDSEHGGVRRFSSLNEFLLLNSVQGHLSYIQKGSETASFLTYVGSISETEHFGNSLWLLTNEGLYRFGANGNGTNKKPTVFEIPNSANHSQNTGDTDNLHIYGDKLWFLKNGELFIIDQENNKLVRQYIRKRTDLNQEENSFELPTYYDSSSDIDPSIRGIITLGDELYLAVLEPGSSTEELCRCRKETSGELNCEAVLETRRLRKLKAFTDRLLVLDSYETTLLNAGSNAKSVPLFSFSNSPDQGSDVWSLEQFNNEYWGYCIGVCNKDKYKLVRWYADKASYTSTHVKNLNEEVTSLQRTGNDLWVGTRHGLFRIGRGEIEASLYMEVSNIRDFSGDGTRFFFTADTPSKENRVFYFDPSQSIDAKLYSSDSIWKNIITWLLGGSDCCLIAGEHKVEVRYAKEDGYEIPDESDRFLFDIGSGNQCGKNFGTDKNAFLPTHRGTHSIVGSGVQTLCVAIRDQHGVPYLLPNKTYVVLPDFVSSVLLLPVLSISVSVVIFGFAPYNKKFHQMIMNPLLRKWFSFGLLPILISTLPFMRWHLLRRYIRGIKKDAEFAEWHERFVYPNDEFHPKHFGVAIRNSRRLLLLGQSGLGKTSYFKHLTSYFACEDLAGNLFHKVIPVFVRLSNCTRENPPEKLILDQLTSYGLLTDTDLNNWFLKQGDFLILFDGVNEISDSDLRKDLSQFIEENWNVNYICLSSQQVFTEFYGLREEKLEPLGKKKICDILQKQLGAEKANQVIRQFSDEMFELYKVPRDLECAIEIVNRETYDARQAVSEGLVLPTSRDKLYEKTLNPIISRWLENQRTTYPPILFEKAYEMLVSRKHGFKRGELPEEIVHDLLNERYRYLVEFSGEYKFRHDLIMAYLASRHFLTKWREALQVEKNLHIGWLELLKFAIPAFERPENVYEIMKNVLEKTSNISFTGELFNWLKLYHPQLCKEWERDYVLLFGDATLNQMKP